jgi:hypothetical protein
MLWLIVERRINMLRIWKKIKASVKKSLDHMAAENKKEYGSGVPDCCKMNRQGNDKLKK